MNKIYAAITIVAIFVAGWFAGKRSSDNYWHKQSETQLQQYNQKLALEDQRRAKLLADISNSHDVEEKQQESRYNELEVENNKINGALSTCRTSNKQLRILQQAANNAMPETDVARLSQESGSGIIAASESSTNFTCQDMSATMIEWSKLYFEQRNKYIQLLKFYESW